MPDTLRRFLKYDLEDHEETLCTHAIWAGLYDAHGTSHNLVTNSKPYFAVYLLELAD